jgi:hypothetical protein
MESLQFLNPWYLAGGLAALVPLAIYLLQRHRAQRVVFGSVWFLRDLAKKIVRRRRASELLLLALRMAIVAVVVAAFARPLLLARPAGGRDGAGGGLKARAILVDVSASMGVADRMADARKAAIAAIDSLTEGDQVAVYTFGNSPSALVAWTADRPAARTAVQALRPSDQGTSLGDALRRVQTDIIDRPEPDKEILVVSDMQATGWADYRGDWTISRTVGLSFADVGGPAAVPANIGIVQVSVPHSSVLGAAQDVVSARVQNFTGEPKQVRLKLMIADKEAASREVPLAGGASQVVSFPYDFKNPGELDGRFVLDIQDAYTPDNQGFFVVAVQPKIRTLVINGSPSGDPATDGAYYLLRAFAPSAESIFQAKEIRPADWHGEDLDVAAVVVLSDVPSLNPEALAALKAFVHRGGGVMFFPGGRTDVEAFNRNFADIAPCRLVKRVSAREEDKSFEGVVISELNLTHPALALFAQPHHGDFSTVRFKQYFTLSDSQASTVLARFENRRPAMLLRKVGKGTSILVASSANQEMNDLALRGVFVPFVQESARFQASASGRRISDVTVGSEVQVELPAGATNAVLVRPGGEKEDLAVTNRPTDAAGLAVGSAPTATFLPAVAGIYRVQSGAGEVLFAANPDPRESDLKRMKSDEIAAALTTQRGQVAEAGAMLHVAARRTQREEVEAAQRWGWYLLVLAAAMLVGEMFLADRLMIRE